MGFFWFSFIQILNDSRRPSPSINGDWGTPKDVVIGFIYAIATVAILGGWFVGIPYYFHVIKGFSGWATFGIWWLITAAFATVIHLLKLDD